MCEQKGKGIKKKKATQNYVNFWIATVYCLKYKFECTEKGENKNKEGNQMKLLNQILIINIINNWRIIKKDFFVLFIYNNNYLIIKKKLQNKWARLIHFK